MAQITADQNRVIKAPLKTQTHPGNFRNHTSVRKERHTSTFNQGDVSEVILKNEMAEMNWKSFLGRKNTYTYTHRLTIMTFPIGIYKKLLNLSPQSSNNCRSFILISFLPCEERNWVLILVSYLQKRKMILTELK